MKTPAQTSLSAWCRLDLLAATAAISILASSLGMTTTAAARRVHCASNLQQIGLAALTCAEDNDLEFPSRDFGLRSWTNRLAAYGMPFHALACPAGHETEFTPHSYLMNSFADYFSSLGSFPPSRAMRAADIPEPNNTILFGEKQTLSSHLYMDDDWFGGDFYEMDMARHFSRPGVSSGGSNYSFVDGSVHFLPFGASITPVDLWRVLPEFRSLTPIPE